jgi:ribosome-associated translation inhibitor RaiA
MQSLQDIIGNRDFDQPAEIEQIKTFVRKQFSSDVNVSVQAHSITITTKSASLAGSLRPLMHKLKKELNTEKKVFIRIG